MEENKKEFKCNQCDRSYALKRVLNMHVKDKHEGTKKCTECDEEFVYNMFQNEIHMMPFWVAKHRDEVTHLK